MSRRSATLSTAPVFAALGDVTRLELVSRLQDGQSHSIAQLTDGLGLTRQGITKHLRVLQDVGIVGSKRVGRERRFALRTAPLTKASAYLMHASAQWDEAIARLKALVEPK